MAFGNQPAKAAKTTEGNFLNLVQGFSTSALLSQISLHTGDCPAHCRMVSSIADLYLLGASSTLHPKL